MSSCCDAVICCGCNGQVKSCLEKSKQEKHPYPHLSYYCSKCGEYLLLCTHCKDTTPEWRYQLHTLCDDVYCIDKEKVVCNPCYYNNYYNSDDWWM